MNQCQCEFKSIVILLIFPKHSFFLTLNSPSIDTCLKIVETMPQTDDVSEFLQKLDNFYEMVEDSDNHNSLKVYNKQTSHGGMSDSGSLDQPFDQSLNGSADFGKLHVHQCPSTCSKCVLVLRVIKVFVASYLHI